jgi:hypothetical protein
MPRSDSPYNRRYLRARAALLARRDPCELRLVCNGDLANSADHVPPLALHPGGAASHVEGSGCCELKPACIACQRVQGRLVVKLKRKRRATAPRPTPAPSRQW